ncbi:MAG TPA: hypothetical protein VFX17_03890 [Patescibacteria group bacterium]|nr:hypothetical protein [Patescibacteria group bacterium]
MKRLVVFVAVCLCFALPAQAQNKTEKPFIWRHYAVNPLVPDRMVPPITGVEPSEKPQITNMVLSDAASYQAAKDKIRRGMAGAYFGSILTPLPQEFWDQVVRQFQDGKVHPKTIQNGGVAGDFPMASGSHPDANGNSAVYVDRDYPVNKTSGPITGWELDEAIPITSGPFAGQAVRPIIYERCRNVSGFRDVPPMVVNPPKDVVVKAQPAPAPTVVPPAPGPIAVAVNNVKIVLPPTPPPPPVPVHKPCRAWGAPCWVWPVVAAAVVGGIVIGVDQNHHSSEPPPESQKQGIPPPPRPTGG